METPLMEYYRNFKNDVFKVYVITGKYLWKNMKWKSTCIYVGIYNASCVGNMITILHHKNYIYIYIYTNKHIHIITHKYTNI